MYKVILLFLLLSITSAKVLNKNKNDCGFNESSEITAKKLLYCRYIREDWNSSEISISELNFYYKLQFKLEKNKQKIFFNYFFDVCDTFYNVSLIYDFFIKQQKIPSKKLVLRPNAFKNLSVLESHNNWMPFNVSSTTVHKNLSNDLEIEIGCKLFYVYELERMFYVYFDIAYRDYTSKNKFTTIKLDNMLYRDLYKLILENPSCTIWKNILSNR